MFDHMRARTGWHDDVACCFLEHANGMFYNRTRFRAQTGVERWLSTAGLVGGEFHVKAEAVENVHDGLTSLRVERIDETGDEKLDVSHESIVIPNPTDFRSLVKQLKI